MTEIFAMAAKDGFSSSRIRFNQKRWNHGIWAIDLIFFSFGGFEKIRNGGDILDGAESEFLVFEL
jgi:hypothetical protein